MIRKRDLAFHERDAAGVPQRWVAMMRRSLLSHGPRFSATRMLREYADRVYRQQRGAAPAAGAWTHAGASPG